MVWNLFAWWFNHVDRMRERQIYAELHKKFYENGFTNQISFYGTLSKPYDDKHVQARIEIMSVGMISKIQMSFLVKILNNYIPDREYTLFLFKDMKLLQVIAR